MLWKISLSLCKYYFFIYHILYFAILFNLEKQENVFAQNKAFSYLFFSFPQKQRLFFVEYFSICKWDKSNRKNHNCLSLARAENRKKFPFPSLKNLLFSTRKEWLLASLRTSSSLVVRRKRPTKAWHYIFWDQIYLIFNYKSRKERQYINIIT